jgi:hypothetical protein
MSEGSFSGMGLLLTGGIIAVLIGIITTAIIRTTRRNMK